MDLRTSKKMYVISLTLLFKSPTCKEPLLASKVFNSRIWQTDWLDKVTPFDRPVKFDQGNVVREFLKFKMEVACSKFSFLHFYIQRSHCLQTSTIQKITFIYFNNSTILPLYLRKCFNFKNTYHQYAKLLSVKFNLAYCFYV